MVEIVPGKVSGAPLIVHSRVRPDDMIATLREGPEWLADNYALPLDTVLVTLSLHASAAGRATHPVDQTVPRALGKLPSGYEVRTAAKQGWGELENGDLLRIAEHAGFLITADRNIVHQQNLKDRTVELIVLSINHWQNDTRQCRS